MDKARSGDEGKIGDSLRFVFSTLWNAEWLNCGFYLQPEEQRAQQAGTLSWHIKFEDHPAFLSQFQPSPALERIILELCAKGISAGGIWVWPYPPTLFFVRSIEKYFQLIVLGRYRPILSVLEHSSSQGSTQAWEQLRKMGISERSWLTENSTQCFLKIPVHEVWTSIWTAGFPGKQCLPGSTAAPNLQELRGRAVRSPSLFTEPRQLKDDALPTESVHCFCLLRFSLLQKPLPHSHCKRLKSAQVHLRVI